jgi:outer membrane protein TolC
MAMLPSLSLCWRWRARLLAGLVPGVLTLIGPVGAAPSFLPPVAPPVPSSRPSQGPANADQQNAPPKTVTALDLAACRQLALQKQPAIAAARSSLAAAIVRQQSLDNLRVPTCLARDLPTRRQQAAVGVAIAQAYLHQAELNTLYGVNFSYVSYLYAKQQVATADEALKNLVQLRNMVEQAIKDGNRPDVSKRDIDKLDIYHLIAQGRRQEAVQGAERALSALREAIGICGEEHLVIAEGRLPDIDVVPDRCQIVALAVSRRPEIVQATNGVEVTSLEVSAQASKHFPPTVPTFASGGDLHSHPLPAGSFDANYMPAAVGPEMPVALTGRRCDRGEQARVYNARAQAVVEKTRNLLVLEAEQAFFRWQEAANKVAQYKKAAAKAEPFFAELVRRFGLGLPLPKGEVVYERRFVSMLDAAVLKSQVTLLRHEAHYRQLIALAELERVTAGGFSAVLDTASKNGKGNNNRNGQP